MREFGQKLDQEKKQLTEPLGLGMLEVYYRCRFFLSMAVIWRGFMEGIKTPNYFEKYKFYSESDACIEIQNDSEYTYHDAVGFVRSLGYTVRSGGHVEYDDVFKDWRGYVNIVIGDETSLRY